MQGIGLDIPSQSLGITHVALAGGLAALALARPRAWVLRLALGFGIGVVALLPILWVGPLWPEGPELFKVMADFYIAFFLSLVIPFGAGAVAVVLLARRSSAPRSVLRGVLPLAAYVVGLVASYPVSFNYSLLYGLIR